MILRAAILFFCISSAGAAEPIKLLRDFPRRGSHAFSADHSRMLRWMYRGNSIALWNLKTNKLVRSWNSEERLLGAAFSDDGKHFATNGSITIGDQTTHRTRIWSVTKAKPLKTFVQRMSVAYVNRMVTRCVTVELFTADVAPMVTEVKLFDISGDVPKLLHTKRIYESDPVHISEPRFTKRSFQFHAHCGLSESQVLWDVTKKDAIVGFGRDYLARDAKRGLHLSWKKERGAANVILWKDAKPQKKIPCMAEQVAGAFSPMADRFLTLTRAGTITLWNAKTGKRERQFRGAANMREVRFNSDGTRFVTRSGSPWAPNSLGVVQLWDPKTAKPLQTIQHRPGVKRVLFVPKRKWLLAWTRTQVVLWKFDEPKPEQIIKSDNPLSVHLVGTDRFVVLPVSGAPKLYGFSVGGGISP